MKNVASKFSKTALDALEKELHITLSDERDYTEDELADLYERITDDFPYAYDDSGEPLEAGRIFEEIIDVFAGPDGLISFED